MMRKPFAAVPIDEENEVEDDNIDRTNEDMDSGGLLVLDDDDVDDDEGEEDDALQQLQHQKQKQKHAKKCRTSSSTIVGSLFEFIASTTG
jgi:hypothetical protein